MKFRLRRAITDVLYQPYGHENERHISLLPGVEVVMARASAYPVTYRHQEWLNVIVSDEPFRSEERRVGKECRSRWSPYH